MTQIQSNELDIGLTLGSKCADEVLNAGILIVC